MYYNVHSTFRSNKNSPGNIRKGGTCFCGNVNFATRNGKNKGYNELGLFNSAIWGSVRVNDINEGTVPCTAVDFIDEP